MECSIDLCRKGLPGIWGRNWKTGETETEMRGPVQSCDVGICIEDGGWSSCTVQEENNISQTTEHEDTVT